MLNFTKMHGCGNDFVIFDGRETPVKFSQNQIAKICDRQFGVGCDQLIIIEPSDKADVFMRIYNVDESESGACGNATRCVADLTDARTIETLGGILKTERKGDLISVDMGVAKIGDQPFTDVIDDLSDPVLVDMGNPHAVYFVDDLETIRFLKTGKAIENHSFFPNRTNVEFVKILNRGEVQLKTWERGVGLTLACGSAACATVAAGVKRGLTDAKLTVHMDGGTLEMELRDDGHVIMTGPTAHVFDGVLKV